MRYSISYSSYLYEDWHLRKKSQSGWMSIQLIEIFWENNVWTVKKKTEILEICEIKKSCKEILQKNFVKINVILSKKITYYIEILIYFNALNWFWRVEDLFKEKNIWTSVNNIISDWATQESDEKDENIKSKFLSEAVTVKTEKAD